MSDHLDSPDTATSYILELELQIEALSAFKRQLETYVLNKDMQIGKLNSERLKFKALKDRAEQELSFLKDASVTKKLFTEKISLLINILQNTRKKSQDEDERKLLEEFISILNKANDK